MNNQDWKDFLRELDENEATGDGFERSNMVASRIRTILSAHPQVAPKPNKTLCFDMWTCINGHQEDHVHITEDGTKLCAHPGCKAEAEKEVPAPEHNPVPTVWTLTDKSGLIHLSVNYDSNHYTTTFFDKAQKFSTKEDAEKQRYRIDPLLAIQLFPKEHVIKEE